MALYSDVVNDTMNFTNITTTGATISGYKTGRTDLGTVSGTVALNLALSNDFTATLNGNTTFSITNTPSTGVVGFSLGVLAVFSPGFPSLLAGEGAFTPFSSAHFGATLTPGRTL